MVCMSRTRGLEDAKAKLRSRPAGCSTRMLENSRITTMLHKRGENTRPGIFVWNPGYGYC